MLHFVPNIIRTSCSFNVILEQAKTWYSKLGHEEQDNLKEGLNHGSGYLTTKSQLKAYLAVYGEIHQAKLLHAFEHIPDKVWIENGISVIDVGCGQGIAEMVLSDFLESKWIDNDIVKEVILIEPSKENLKQAVEYISCFFPETDVSGSCMSSSQLNYDNVKVKSNTVLYIFSNVVDLDSFDYDKIAEIISSDTLHNNIVVCISPFYQEGSRGKRMYDFGEKLYGHSLHYKLEKHIEDWNKSYSCQIHIYVSSYY